MLTRQLGTGRKAAIRLGATLAAVAALMLATVGLPASPAHADLFNPRQDWLRDATAGVFLHWGERTSPVFTDCAKWESAINAGGWDANYWVRETKKLHASYMVLATFHSRLGYARAWPSAIPGTCATKRDYLKELLDAAHKADLHVILYMTDDPQHHAENGFEYFNSGAYSKFKGHTVDLSTRDGFGEFSFDNFMEVMDKYPSLDGFWIDNLNDFWNAHNLFQTVRSKRPNMLISNNNEDTPLFDTVSHEQKTGMTPDYDMPQAIWTPAPRLTEADYKLPSSGQWWFDGSNSTVDKKLSIDRYIANAGSSIKSLMAETAMVGGRFPSNQESFNTFADGYLSQIWESIGGTEGGGYLNGGLQPGPFGSGAYGVTTVSKTNANLHYVHVLDKATSGSSIAVRDNGYVVRKVTDLRTGASRPFTQSKGTITISGITDWDPFDTVLKVETSGRTGIYPVGSVTASATSSASGNPAANLVDGSYLNFWDSNSKVPVSITLNLGSAKKVAYLAVNQREWSPTQNRTTFGRQEDSARIRDYTVSVSDDGTTFRTVKTATMPSRRAVQFVDLNVASTKFVRLTVNSTWAASSVPNFFHKLRIDELWLGSAFPGDGGTPPPPPAPPPGKRFEAEDATISAGGTVDSNHTGFSGTGFVNYPNMPGGFVEWSVPASAAGNGQLTVRYANGTADNRPLDVSVNGGPATAVNFAATGSWDTWADVTVTVPLVAGANRVRMTATGAMGGPNLDFIEAAG